MKERKIILVLTALFGLAIALRAGYEEIIRSREPGSSRPVRRAAAPPRNIPIGVIHDKLAAAPGRESKSPVGPHSDDDVSGLLFDGAVRCGMPVTGPAWTSTWAETEPSSSSPGEPHVDMTPNVAPAVPDEPPAPPPVKPDGDKTAAPGGTTDPPAPSPPPAGPEAGKDPNVLTLLGGGRLKIKERRLEIDGVLCKRDAKVALELLACAPGGKEHESVFILKVPPRELHTALLLMGLESGEDRGGGGPKFQGDSAKPVGDRVAIDVSWTKDGKTTTLPAEELLMDRSAGAPMKRTGWTFTGSKLIDEVDVDTGRPTGRSFYAASRDRSLVTVYHDPVSVLDNPMKNGASDLVYVPREEILPDVGTAVMFVFRPAAPGELKAFQKNETDADAAWDAKNPPPKEGPPDPAPGPGSPHPPDFEGPLPGPKPGPEGNPETDSPK